MNQHNQKRVILNIQTWDHQMKKFLVVCVMTFICALCQSLAGAWPQEKGALYAKTYLGSLTAPRFWDMNGQSISSMKEEIAPGSPLFKYYPEGRKYSMDFSAIIAGLYAEYGVTDKLTIIADMPFGYFSLTETYETDKDTSSNTYLQKPLRQEKSLSTFTYYGIGGRYLLYDKKSVVSVSAGLRIPPGGTNGIFADTVGMPFLSDGAFQNWFGLEIGLPFTDGWFETEIKYTGRHEELRDEVTFHAEYGNKSVEEIMLKFAIDITQGLGSRKEIPAFDTRRTILVENIGAITIGVIVQASETLFIEGSYQVRLFGENTWALNGTFGGIGIKTTL